MSPADPKPPKRIVNPRAVTDKVLMEQALHPFPAHACRCCQGRRRTSPFGWKLDGHHLVPKSLGGDDVAANVVGLCHPCHMDFEGGGEARRIVATAVRESLAPHELGYVLEKKSQAWLDRYYPAPRPGRSRG